MRRWLTRGADAALTWLGESFAKLWVALLGLAILISFPVAGFAFSFLIGWEAMVWLGGGFWTLLTVAYLFGLFLSVYVWSASVKATTFKLIELIRHGTPN
jgi:hypothetical protein